ncbi:hypothetical protein M378DRAFT_13896 [Amanita muscaria Koide BX008]|uniref:Uncharacterized protein n=1 Tax=Amanita muscaria (strain Koide BX008) TaxID=946122 RepID=A0A0C2SCZ5_AMAMK|nr:hypothetical protein M378DRAFT_13896 [Amanita muscaria Koide BX008]
MSNGSVKKTSKMALAALDGSKAIRVPKSFFAFGFKFPRRGGWGRMQQLALVSWVKRPEEASLGEGRCLCRNAFQCA